MGTRHETRETRDARRETRDARRETRDARRETRDARRETRDARRETRDARRETRDARRETRDARRETWARARARARARAWQRGAWAQCSGFVPKRPKRFMRINSRLSRSACACLCGSTRLVGPWATCCEGRLDDHHAVRSVPCEAAPDYQPRELDVTTVLGEARANACPERFMRINRGSRDRPLCHVSQKPPEKN
ncbi:hypothetical protein ABIE53_004663 [Burkholderia sp. OAS925]